jgi:hypothetical protein
VASVQEKPRQAGDPETTSTLESLKTSSSPSASRLYTGLFCYANKQRLRQRFLLSVCTHSNHQNPLVFKAAICFLNIITQKWYISQYQLRLTLLLFTTSHSRFEGSIRPRTGPDSTHLLHESTLRLSQVLQSHICQFWVLRSSALTVTLY